MEEIIDKPREKSSLELTLEAVQRHHKDVYVVEVHSFDNKPIVYYLKKVTKNKFVTSWMTEDVVRNILNVPIGFKKLGDVEYWLKQQYSTADGFLTDKQDLQ
jgi:hypothetical protein